ncbi:MAG: sialate O-acetylesterase, partial [Verrucomicrobia bacterium]|nr:sialate O-acetylesterase [Verrucomicrobiota bacterium]
APITPFRFRGVIWYQGESNAKTAVMARIYKAQMQALLADWRRDFRQPNLPFAQVMLAGFNAKSFPGWCGIRQAQLETFMEDPHGGLATAHDIGSLNNIHPTNKLDVGQRLADWALGQVYGQKDAVAHGPLAETFAAKRSVAQVTFKSPGGNLKSSDGEPLRGFELAGKDGIFHPAIAQIGKAGTVRLKSDPVSSPVSVRYGWTAMPDVNLVDAKGFPAFPFKLEKTNGTL